MYRGTFQSPGSEVTPIHGRGIYFTQSRIAAAQYAHNWEAYTKSGDKSEEVLTNARIVPAYLKIENPKIVRRGEYDQISHIDEDQLRQLREAGHDGIIYYAENPFTPKDIEAGDIAEAAVFEPTQIKSAIGNKGTFDPKSPDIRDAFDPNEARNEKGEWSSGGGETPEQDKLVNYANTEQEDVLNLGSFVQGGIGFLTTKGEMIASMSGGPHERDAKAAGTTLDDLLNEGVARIYADEPFLGIEIHGPPTKHQANTLLKYAATGYYNRFAIEGAKHSISWPGKVELEGPALTPRIVREKLKEAVWTRDAGPPDEERDPHGRWTSGGGDEVRASNAPAQTTRAVARRYSRSSHPWW
jgi:ADP-Ribosyltransferase in polyvalent proteins